MEKKQLELIGIPGVYGFWKDWVKTLKKSDKHIIAADFDYTLFSRDEQLENEPKLRENRGDNGPKYIFEHFGMMNFLEKYHLNKSFPQDIINKMNPEHDIILTAGIYEFQMAKIKLCKELDPFKTLITKNGSEKIISLIRYVLFELKYLPSKVTIYEDRPEYFIQYKDLIEDVLGCELEIVYVEMDGNTGYKKMETL